MLRRRQRVPSPGAGLCRHGLGGNSSLELGSGGWSLLLGVPQPGATRQRAVQPDVWEKPGDCGCAGRFVYPHRGAVGCPAAGSQPLAQTARGVAARGLRRAPLPRPGALYGALQPQCFPNLLPSSVGGRSTGCRVHGAGASGGQGLGGHRGTRCRLPGPGLLARPRDDGEVSEHYRCRTFFFFF